MKEYNNDNMRRSDRTLEQAQAHEIIRSAPWCVMSMVEQRCFASSGYGVPMNFVWDGAQHIYMHCATSGHKLECIDHCAEVSLCIVGQTQIIEEEFTTNFQSVIIRGEIVRHLDDIERLKALGMLVDKYSPKHKSAGEKLSKELLHRTEILRLNIESISGKNKVG